MWPRLSRVQHRTDGVSPAPTHLTTHAATHATTHATTQVHPPLRGLYAITPDEALTMRLVAQVAAVVAGGAVLVQYRNKSASRDLRRQQIIALLPVCHTGGARLIVNDDIELAVELNADGAHLGRDDIHGASLFAARETLGPQRILGVSCYNELSRAERAALAGADYLAVGSMFASSTKPAATRAGLETLAETRRFNLPVAAIGGITLDNAPTLIAAGADLLAVISDLFDAADIQQQAQNYAALFTQQAGEIHS